jgi:hypothetical protein
MNFGGALNARSQGIHRNWPEFNENRKYFYKKHRSSGRYRILQREGIARAVGIESVTALQHEKFGGLCHRAAS